MTEHPAHYRYDVGNLEVVVVSDGYRTSPLPDGFIRNASREEINAVLEAAGMPADRMTILFNPIVVRSGARTIVLDTGYGEAAAAQPGATMGQFSENLRSAGIMPEAVDLVVISHFHPDHINGLHDAAGSPRYPNAGILVPEREWTFWTDASSRAAAPEGRMRDTFANVARIFEPLADRVRTFKPGEEIAEGVQAVATPGHTIGHSSFLLESKGTRVFVQCDVTNHPALFVRNPHWHAAFDQDPQQAEATRRRVYEWLVDERIAIQGFHYPFPGLARVAREGSGYAVTPISSP